MYRNLIRGSILGASVALAALGCSSGSSSTDGSGGSSTSSGTGTTQSQHVVELFSWWISPGEAEALQALVDTFEKDYPEARVTNDGDATGADANAKLDMDIDTAPPDCFQNNASNLPAFLMKHPGTVASLDDFFADPALKAAVLPDVLADVTVDNHVYAMPVGMHRENSFFFNKQIFAAQALTPPTSVADLLDVCAKLKTAGITPIAIGGQGWIIREMWNSILEGSIGTTMYRDVMTGAKPMTDPDVQTAFNAAIDALSTILTNYVDTTQLNDPNFGWTNAADAVHDGKAAMYLHGDWVKGYFQQLGWSPGVDFGQTGAPGASDLFLYGVDTFGMPVNAPHPTDAHDFLTVVASKEGQAAFNKLKGSTPMRTDVRDLLDPLGQATLDDLVNAKVRMALVNEDGWDQGCLQFAMDNDKEAFLKVYVDSPP